MYNKNAKTMKTRREKLEKLSVTLCNITEKLNEEIQEKWVDEDVSNLETKYDLYSNRLNKISLELKKVN